MPTPILHASTLTLGASKIAFKYVLENVLQYDNVNRALDYAGIDDIISFVKLTDSVVDNLVYNDPDPTVLKLHRLKLGPILCIKSFIHYVHFCEEANPINNDWLSITMNDYDQFRFNLAYMHDVNLYLPYHHCPMSLMYPMPQMCLRCPKSPTCLTCP
jgi:hypothetical protein